MFELDNLICYGCAHSVAPMIYSDGTPVEETMFPGCPSGERPCQFCIRNPEVRGKSREEMIVSVWYNGSEPAKVPMDCYHSLDMKDQFNKWLEETSNESNV
jgi:hypothetical protein